MKKSGFGKLLSRVFWVLLLAIAGVTGAHAQDRQWCQCGEPLAIPLQIEIDHHQQEFIDQAIVSLERWNLYAELLDYSPGDGLAAPHNGRNEFVFASPQSVLAAYGVLIDNSVLALTAISPPHAFGTPAFNGCPLPQGTVCGSIVESDVIFNNAQPRGWAATAPAFDDSGPLSYLATTLHEIGHVLGLHHNFTNVSTMNLYADIATQYLGQLDADAARNIGNAKSVIDMATFPFRFDGFQIQGLRIARPSQAAVAAGDSFILRDFSLENLGDGSLEAVTLKIFLSLDEQIEASDIMIAALEFSQFDLWWDTAGIELSVPAATPIGAYHIGAAVFVGTAQDSLNYNNQWVLDSSRRVHVTGPDVTGPVTLGAGLVNLSTLTSISAGDPAIAGFIVRGNDKRLVFVGENESGLQNPSISITTLDGAPLAGLSNDDWRDWSGAQALTEALGRSPKNSTDAMLGASLGEGGYIAWLRDEAGGGGRGNIQILDLDGVEGDLLSGKLLNLSTLSRVTDDAVVAGFIVRGNASRYVMIGENLDGMADPRIEITTIDAMAIIAANDNWQDWPNAVEITVELGRQPVNNRDALVALTLNPGTYLAWLRDRSPSANGVGIIQIQQLP